MKKVISTKTKYSEEVISKMKEKFNLKNTFSVPKIEKVILNCGIGKITKEADKVEEVFKSLLEISGQRPVKVKTIKAIAGFKVRENTDVGIKVTLRGKKMWNFIDRLINSALPRTRDFQGIEEGSVDQSGNLNIGIKEHTIFPEIVQEKVKNVFSFQVNVVSNAKDKEKGKELFKLLGFPIK
jgi:large subunit ribosomal protein L5